MTKINHDGVGYLKTALLSLLICTLLGCTAPVVVPKAIAQGDSSVATATRAVIYFKQSPADSKPLSAAISLACHCQPVFFRPYLAEGLIYELALPAGHSFADFERALMGNAANLGIKAVEQDRIMQHQ